MKSILFWLFFFAVALAYAQNNQVQLIPQPFEIIVNEGFFELTNKTTLSYSHDELRVLAEMLTQKLNTPTGFSIQPKQGKTGTIKLLLFEVSNTRIGQEGYLLTTTPKGVVIEANQPAGIYYGIQTLLQLLPKEIESTKKEFTHWVIPQVQIIDFPRFAWRGIMLDVSRHFFTKEEVKTYIKQISRLKFNTLHWHLVDDNGWRIEIKSLPKLTEIGAWRVERAGTFGNRANPKPGEIATVGGFYTQDEIREIVKFAQDHNVTIIPEIDMPGHSMAAIAAYPELCCTKDTNVKVDPGTNFAEWYGDGTFKMLVDNTLNPSDEKVYEFIDKVFTEVSQLFPAPYIHAGGDECYHGYWAKDTGCITLMQKLNVRDVKELQNYFTGRVEKIIQSKGKKMIGWEEIIDGSSSSESVIMSWHGMQGAINAANKGYYSIMTPAPFVYLDYNQGEQTVDPPIYSNLRVSKSYRFEPVPDSVDAKFILGGQGNLWTEQVPTFRHVEYMSYPRAWALSEVFWSPKEARNWPDFVQRMETHFNRADVADVNYSLAVYDAIVTTFLKEGKLFLQLATEIPDIDIFFSFDGTMPGKYSMKFKKPVELPEGPITLRVITYRNGKPIGHLITLNREQLMQRAY